MFLESRIRPTVSILDPIAVEQDEEAVEVEPVRRCQDLVQCPSVVHAERQNLSVMRQTELAVDFLHQSIRCSASLQT